MPTFIVYVKKHYTVIILVLIVALAAFLRFYNLSSNPLGLNQDEAVNGIDAFFLGQNLHDHHNNLIGPMLQSFNDWASPMLTFITIPFVKVFGLSVFTIRAVPALLGVLGVLAFYYLIDLITKNKSIALLGAFVLAISPFSVHLSRWAIPPSIVSSLLIFLLVPMVVIIQKTNESLKIWYIWFGLVTLFGVMLTYAYPTMKLFAPLLLIAFWAVNYKEYLWKNFVSAVAYVAAVSPIYYLTIMYPSVYNARFATETVTANGEGYVDGFLKRFWEYYSPYFLFGRGDANGMQQVPGFPLLPEVISLFFYVGLVVVAVCIYRILRKKSGELLEYNNRLVAILAWLALTYPVAASLTKDNFMSLRAIHGGVVAIIIAMVGLDFIRKNLVKPQYFKYIILAIVIPCLVLVTQFSVVYFTQYPMSQQRSFNNGIEDMLTYAKANQGQYDDIYLDLRTIPQVYYLFFNTDTALQWQGKTDKVTENGVEGEAYGKYKFFNPYKGQEENFKLVHEAKSSNGEVIGRVYEIENTYELYVNRGELGLDHVTKVYKSLLLIRN